MVVQPALRRPQMPSAVMALFTTSPQKGATSLDQSAVLMSCRPLASAIAAFHNTMPHVVCLPLC
jgi:hypothetical protein